MSGYAHVRNGSRSYGDGGKGLAPLSLCETDGGAPMTQVDDLSRSLITFEQNSTMVVVLEMSQSSWLAAGVVPGIERRPLKKLDPDPMALLRLVEGWRDHAMKAGRMITRIVLSFEAGRDGFWLARWLRARNIEPFVIHSTSVAVSREHRRAKTDRLDTEMLIRVFLGWLRGEPRHCKMVAIPTLEEEDARRPSRVRESLIGERTRIINRMKAALIRLGIRGFKPELLKAPQRLEAQHTAEGVPIPPNMLDELRRDMARLAWVREQINAIEQARLNAWNRRRAVARMQWCGCWQASSVLVSRQRICWCRRSCRETFETDGPWLVTPASPGRPTRAGSNDVRRAWRRRAMHACGAASFSWRGASCASRRKAHWGNGIEPGPKARRESVRRR